jgi:hypothetical protein
MINLYDIKNVVQLKNKLRWFKDKYFLGKLLEGGDDATIQTLKGMVRETENKKILRSLNIDYKNIINLRSKFYTTEAFKKIEHSQKYMLANSLEAKKNIEHIKIWGYRSIWYKYDVSVANMFIPVSKKEQIEYKKKYRRYFSSQKDASYPYPFSTKDFATITIIEQQNNLVNLKILLGEKYFSEHKNPRIKQAVGIIYMREISAQEFIKDAQKFKIDNNLELGMAQTR